VILPDGGIDANCCIKKSNKMEKKPIRDKQPAEIEKIKEILFGSNIEDIENRFSSLESKIADEANTMLNTFREDFSKLKKSFEEEIAVLNKRISDNQDRIAEVENKVDKEINTINDKILSHIKSWKEKNAEIEKEANNHDKKIQNLQNVKLDTSRFIILIESVLKKIRKE